VASISRLLKIIGLFFKKLYKRDYILQKETYNFKETARLQKNPVIFRSLLIEATPWAETIAKFLVGSLKD